MLRQHEATDCRPDDESLNTTGDLAISHRSCPNKARTRSWRNDARGNDQTRSDLGHKKRSERISGQEARDSTTDGRSNQSKRQMLGLRFPQQAFCRAVPLRLGLRPPAPTTPARPIRGLLWICSGIGPLFGSMQGSTWSTHFVGARAGLAL